MRPWAADAGGLLLPAPPGWCRCLTSTAAADGRAWELGVNRCTLRRKPALEAAWLQVLDFSRNSTGCKSGSLAPHHAEVHSTVLGRLHGAQDLPKRHLQDALHHPPALAVLEVAQARHEPRRLPLLVQGEGHRSLRRESQGATALCAPTLTLPIAGSASTAAKTTSWKHYNPGDMLIKEICRTSALQGPVCALFGDGKCMKMVQKIMIQILQPHMQRPKQKIKKLAHSTVLLIWMSWTTPLAMAPSLFVRKWNCGSK